MLTRRLAASRALLRRPNLHTSRFRVQTRCLSELEDPEMNGGYVNPPRQKRSQRDPYGDWWDKQERRNFGEPLHEDNDVLGIFSPEEYTHFTPGWSAVLFGTFVVTFLGVCAAVYPFYPDKPSVPRTFPGGLDRELGGPGAVIARKDTEEATWD